jgi:photosystem II stability/assembly factor-like uncharacterized protein
MRLASTAPFVSMLAVSLALPAPARAQKSAPAPDAAEPARIAEAGDKTRGEEEQIRKREEWFVESRGLRTVARPDLYRAAAAFDLARRRRERADELTASGQVWTPMGPLTMTMLSWSMGPVAGRVVALAVDPLDENVNYIGTATGGLWKTVDGGSSWTSLFDDVGTMSVGALALEPGNPNVVWAGTGERQSTCTNYFGIGIFKSTDGGDTWVARNGSGTSALELSYVNSIAVHPTNPDTLLASGEAFCLPDGTRVGGGVFKTTDGGLTWTRVKSGTGSDVIYDPVNPSIVYLAMSGEGVYKSGDGGDTWTLTPGITPGTRLRLAMATGNSQILYSLGSNSQLNKTVNGGTSWTLQNAGACDGQCTYNLTLDIDPTDPNHIIVGVIRFWDSSNSGVTLTAMTSTWGSGQAVHQDTHVVRFSRINPARFWIAGDGGIWRTDTGGFNYFNLNGNLLLTQFYDVAIDSANPARMFGGAQDNSSSGRFGSDLWNVTVVTGDGFMNAIDPSVPTRVLQTSYPQSNTPSVYRSNSSGNVNTFSRLATNGIEPGEPFPWVTPLAMLPGMIYVASHSLYQGDAGQPTSTFTWTKISPLFDPAGRSVSVITLHPPGTATSPRTPPGDGAYVGTASTSGQGGFVWRAREILGKRTVWENVTGNYPGGYVSDIAVDPVDPDRVYVARGLFNLSRLYRSTTGGNTWIPVGAGLPNVPANAVAVDPTDARRVFVGTDVGVYESADYGATFAPFMQGMPLGTVVTDLEINAFPYVLVAGTYGRGAYRVDLIAIPAAPTVEVSAEDKLEAR